MFYIKYLGGAALEGQENLPIFGIILRGSDSEDVPLAIFDYNPQFFLLSGTSHCRLRSGEMQTCLQIVSCGDRGDRQQGLGVGGSMHRGGSVTMARG